MKDKCERCGFDNKYALVEHHKDRNPENNAEENKETLCANCHYIEHQKRFNNKWSSPIMKVLKQEGKIIRIVLRNNNSSGKILLPHELIGEKVYVVLT